VPSLRLRIQKRPHLCPMTASLNPSPHNDCNAATRSRVQANLRDVGGRVYCQVTRNAILLTLWRVMPNSLATVCIEAPSVNRWMITALRACHCSMLGRMLGRGCTRPARHQSGGKCGRHRPADDAAAVGIEHHREIQEAGRYTTAQTQTPGASSKWLIFADAAIPATGASAIAVFGPTASFTSRRDHHGRPAEVRVDRADKCDPGCWHASRRRHDHGPDERSPPFTASIAGNASAAAPALLAPLTS
jgi:hypothetical protein